MRLTIQEAAAYLAQGAANSPGNQGEDFGKSSPMALLLVIVFAIAVVFLIRSMTRHLKKVPTTFDEQRAEAAAPQRARRSAASAASDDQQPGEEETRGNSQSEQRDGSGSRA
jgi:hypothetical protein